MAEPEHVLFGTDDPDTDGVSLVSEEGFSGEVSPHEVTLSWDDHYDEEMSRGVWGFGLVVGYGWDSGLRCAPKAGPSRYQVAIWRCHSEICFKKIMCVSARLGGDPKLPHIDTGDPNDVLLTVERAIVPPECLPDGKKLLKVSCLYTYVMQTAQDVSEPILIPNHILRIDGAIQLFPDSFPMSLTQSVSPLDFTGSKITY